MEFRNISVLVGIGLVLIYALGSGFWVSTSPGWYSSLVRPPWQPPDIVFGLIWPYNFLVLGVAAFRLPQSLNTAQGAIWLLCFALSVATALMWAYHFYVPHHLNFAAICLGITSLLTVPMLFLAYRASWVLGALLTPYQLWVVVATSLAWGYAARN